MGGDPLHIGLNLRFGPDFIHRLDPGPVFQAIAGMDRFSEFRLFDNTPERLDAFAAFFSDPFLDDQARQLSHAFHNQHAGHDRL